MRIGAASHQHQNVGSGVFRSVLICLPPQTALDAAATLAGRLVRPGGRVQVFRAHGPRPPDAFRPDIGRDALRHQRIELLPEISGSYAPEPILERVARERHDLLLTVLPEPADRLTRVERTLIRTSPAPVWLVRERCGLEGPVVAALDSEAREAGVELNARVLRMAASLATALGARLKILSCWQPYGEHLLRPRAAPENLSAYVESVRASARRSVEEIVAFSRVPVDPRQVSYVKGYFRDAAPVELARSGAALLVVGSRGRAGVTLLRPNAEEIFPRVTCSIAVVK